MRRDPLRPGVYGRFRVAGRPRASAPAGCYAISAVDGAIATSETGERATYPCEDEPAP